MTTTQPQASGLTVGSTVYPAGDYWLGGNTNVVNGGSWSMTTGYCYEWPWWRWGYDRVEIKREMVKLKLSEVETLREMARSNEAAKTVLNKLAHLIEIEVDF